MKKITILIFAFLTLISFSACNSNYSQESSAPTSETPELIVEEPKEEETDKEDSNPIVLEDLGIKISFPEEYKIRESKGYRDENAIYYLRNENKSQMPVDLRVSDEKIVTEFAENYEADVFCIDHGICDENFDPTQFITLFNNQKSMIVGDGSQQAINSQLFSGTFSSPFDDQNHEIKTLNSRKYIISNSSFVPSGEVWREYTTFVNGVRIQMGVIWGLDRKMDHNKNLHQYDSEADKVIETFTIELLKEPILSSEQT